MPGHERMQREGAEDELEGKVREAWGKLTDDEREELRGKAEEVWGKTQRKAGEAIDEATDED